MRFYILLGLMLVLYLFPWLVNPAASLSPNAYDLAEWASLHPAVHAQTPILLTSLLLRLPLACLALLVAFSTRRGIIPALLIGLIAVALLPPLEFIYSLDDPNYRQQATLALLALVGGAVGWSGLLPRYRHWIAAAVALIGAAASLIGLAQGYDLMRGFELPTQIGSGGIALGISMIVTAGAVALNQTGQR